MKLTCIVGNSYLQIIARAGKRLGFDLRLFSTQRLDDKPGLLDEAIKSMGESDLIFMHRGSDAIWDEIESRMSDIEKSPPIVCLGYDQSYWLSSTAPTEVVVTANAYLTYGGEDNISNMLQYLCQKLLNMDVTVEPPHPMPWEGAYHPDAPGAFKSIEEYLEWYEPDDHPIVGILLSRFYWVNRNLAVEDELIRALEREGLNVIPVFSYSVRDVDLGTRSMAEVVWDYFFDGDKSRIDAMIKTSPFFLGQDRNNADESKRNQTGIALLKKLNAPVFEPVLSNHMTLDEWENGIGLSNDIGWGVAMPEFEGMIEPIIIGAASRRGEYEERTPILERCERLAKRAKNWIELAMKPVSERRVAFILHNNPCASVEAAVGGGAHLDTIESVARIMNRMADRRLRSGEHAGNRQRS